jgi:hypothetical protein
MKLCSYCRNKATTEHRAAKKGKTALLRYTCENPDCNKQQRKEQELYSKN